MLDFLLLLIMIVVCVHFHVWQNEYKRVQYISYIGGGSQLYC